MHHSNKQNARPKGEELQIRLQLFAKSINECQRSVSVIFLMITDDDYDEN
jgi:hypothetical protein